MKFFWGCSTTKRGNKCYHLPLENMLVSKDVTFVEHQVDYLRGDLHASLKGEEKSWDVLPLSFTSLSSSETFALTSRGFLKSYRLIYLTR